MVDLLHRLLNTLSGPELSEVREELGIVGYTLKQGEENFIPLISLPLLVPMPICLSATVEMWMLSFWHRVR